jgi:type IV pilus assembly protein PilB
VYKGRIGVFETLLVTGPIREAILRRATKIEIEKAAVEYGMITMRESALNKLRDGITTLEEVIRETKVE